MKKCLVIGGGLAGLSSAVYLSQKNINVTLFEASPKLGGRTYSIIDKKFNSIFDNGQHILMGCYYNTFDYLDKIGSLKNLEIQESLTVNFVSHGGGINKLAAPKYLYPLNLLWGIFNYKAISIKERFKIVDLILDVACCYEEDIQNICVADWLKMKGQSDNAVKYFWEILVAGTMNTSLEKASALMFKGLLIRMFLDGTKAASIVLPKVGLSELFIDPAKKFLENNNSQVKISETVKKFTISRNRISSVITDKNSYSDFDSVVCAVPAFSVLKFEIDGEISPGKNSFEEIKKSIEQFEYSPILNIHLWLSENPFKEKFYGLLDSKIHWLFNHKNHISITTSNAGLVVGNSNEEILNEYYSELEKYFPIFNRNLVVNSLVLKEKRATFIPNSESNTLREKIYSPFENLVLAGDWINTGLPATIEGAIYSGKIAAEKFFV